MECPRTNNNSILKYRSCSKHSQNTMKTNLRARERETLQLASRGKFHRVRGYGDCRESLARLHVFLQDEPMLAPGGEMTTPYCVFFVV